VPLAQWFRKDLKDFAHDVLLDTRTSQRGILRPARVAQLLGAHLAGRRDYSSQLWSLICFELWCRQWWDR
jgi:asparagine synthase (glutamine-hydrolysing)